MLASVLVDESGSNDCACFVLERVESVGIIRDRSRTSRVIRNSLASRLVLGLLMNRIGFPAIIHRMLQRKGNPGLIALQRLRSRFLHFLSGLLRRA